MSQNLWAKVGLHFGLMVAVLATAVGGATLKPASLPVSEDLMMFSSRDLPPRARLDSKAKGSLCNFLSRHLDEEAHARLWEWSDMKGYRLLCRLSEPTADVIWAQEREDNGELPMDYDPGERLERQVRQVMTSILRMTPHQLDTTKSQPRSVPLQLAIERRRSGRW